MKEDNKKTLDYGDINWKVFVRCFTFNQAKYITDATNGFTMQQTDFPFVCAIVDDCSTDGEQNVINKYVEDNFNVFSESKETNDASFTFWQHKTNKNCFFVCIFLKYNHYSIKKNKNQYIQKFRDNSEYEAMCEGDDYWIDPLKLQKQVDYMDSHKDVSLCFTDFNFLYQERGAFKDSILKSYPEQFPHEYTIEEWILAKKYVGPMTWLYRCNIIDKIPNISWIDGTFVWFAYFLAKGKVGCLLNDTTAVYRISDSGVTHQKIFSKTYQRALGMLFLQLKLADIFLPNCKDFKERIYKEWTNANLKRTFFSEDPFGINVILKHQNLLSIQNKFLLIGYHMIPTFFNYIYGKHLYRKGFILH